MPLQVPGGTVDPGEDVHLAAYREFEEETGIKVRDGMAHLETVDYAFPDEQGTELHRRHCFICGYGTNSQKRGIIMKCRPVMAARQSFFASSGSTGRRHRRGWVLKWRKVWIKSVSSWQSSCLVLVKIVAYSPRIDFSVE
ncbi:MutT/nudix family protein [Brucella melitensis]|nr:MutT/nudix family protein [Brucella melitensis]